MLISCVFSFKNEEDNLPELIRRVSHVFSENLTNFEFEMVFVNDASSDSSLDILINYQQKYPIRIVNLSRTFGVTPGILAGLEHSKGDSVIIMDSDLQDPPEIIPKLIEKFKDGADVVHTTREKRHGEGRLKLYLTKLAYKMINFFSVYSLPENTGDFKLLSSRAIKHILDLKEYDPYMRGLSVWIGFKQEYVLYTRDARFSGNTKFPIFSKGPILEFLRGITAYSAAPLYLLFFIGFFTTLTSFILILWALITKILGISEPGTSGLLMAISFFSGVIIMSNGVLGIYISKIFYDVKSRPRFIVENVLEKK